MKKIVSLILCFAFILSLCACEKGGNGSTDAKTESSTNSSTESKTESKNESQTESKTNSSTESQTESKTKSKNESETESSTNSSTESKTKSKNESKTESSTNSSTEPQTESKTKSKNESKIKVNADKIKNISDDMKLSEFDAKFLSYIESKTSGNYMVSPLSFRYALGLALSGARGKTRTEMYKALGVKSVEEWTAYCTKFNGFAKQYNSMAKNESDMFGGRIAGIGEKSEKSAPTKALRVTNSVWKNGNVPVNFKSSYKKYISANYDAEYYLFNEKNAAKKINDWVNKKTNKMIPALVPDNYDASDLAVVLMNALYYKNNWITPFHESLTKKDNFHTEKNKTVKKDFMRQTDNFGYYSDKDTQLVILPMSYGVNMAFVLGKTDNISENISNAARREVDVKIPKMDMETSFTNGEFKDFLKKNGVRSAFDSAKADFSGMLDYNIWVDDILQKTRIKTDEEGVEAAAVTAFMNKATAMPNREKPVEFIADRPFSFYIYTTLDGTTAILFAGKVAE